MEQKTTNKGGLRWAGSRGEDDGGLNHFLWLTEDTGHPGFLQLYDLLPHPVHFETSGGFKTKLFTNIYLQGFFSLLVEYLITVQASDHVHQSIEHLN